MITTNNQDLYEKLCGLRNHGMVRDRKRFQLKDDGPWCYEMQSLGFNYRMTDIQAALGISQLDKLSRFVEKRREIAARYREAFKDIKTIRVPEEVTNSLNSYHLFAIQLQLSELSQDRAHIFQALTDKGLGLQVHYIPIPRQPYYQGLGYKPEDYPAANAYYDSAISIPIFPKMTDQQVEYVISSVSDVLSDK